MDRDQLEAEVQELRASERPDSSATAEEPPADAAARAPQTADGSWGAVLKRTLKGVSRDNLTDWAAALTYYGVLSIFPALIVLVSILGLVGSPATQPLIDNLGQVAPGPAKEIFKSAIKNLQARRARPGSCSSSVSRPRCGRRRATSAAFMRASNAIYDMPGRAPGLEAAAAARGTDARAVGPARGQRGRRDTDRRAGQAGRRRARAQRHGRERLEHRQVAGAARGRELHVRAALLGRSQRQASEVPLGVSRGCPGPGRWIVASLAFAFYVANFGSYNKTYGALAGPIVFLVWLWISNLMILLGAEFNAELERGRVGIEPRDTRKIE